MRERFPDLRGVLAALIALVSLTPGSLAAQAPGPTATEPLPDHLQERIEKDKAALREYYREMLSQQQARTKRAVNVPKDWTPPRTPWGDPDLQGVYTNVSESNTPFEKPAEFEGRRLEDFTDAELIELSRVRQRNSVDSAAAANDGVTPDLFWFEHFFSMNSRAWLVVDPPDGRVPPLTAKAQQRVAAIRPRPRWVHTNTNTSSWLDRNLFERCITRGLPGSMMPTIYGNSYDITQGPGYVAIRYEMIHETRVIPVDGRPHVGNSIRLYMGNARGYWDGDTLVVETTNFTDKTPYRQSTPNMRLVERFKRTAPDKVEWSVTVDDPATWSRPWTFSMPLTQDASQPLFEYACHEGNRGLRNILSGGRVQDAEESANER
jgi:hypothetical protein